MKRVLVIRREVKGGAGSGNFNHAGLAGVHGGSAPKGGGSSGSGGSTSASRQSSRTSPRRFSNSTEANDYFESNQTIEFNKLERDAITAYTEFEFEDINSALREGSPPPSNTFDLLSAVNKGRAAEEITVKRSFGHAATESLFSNGSIVAGETTLSDKGFMSTSANLSYKPDGIIGGNINLEITVPEGSRGIYLEGITSTKGEYEFLMPPNTTLRIDSYTDTDGRFDVKATVVSG